MISRIGSGPSSDSIKSRLQAPLCNGIFLNLDNIAAWSYMNCKKKSKPFLMRKWAKLAIHRLIKNLQSLFQQFCNWCSFSKWKKVRSTYIKEEALMKSESSDFCSPIKINIWQTQKVLGTSVQTCAGLYDFLLTFGNTYLKEYYTQIF